MRAAAPCGRAHLETVDAGQNECGCRPCRARPHDKSPDFRRPALINVMSHIVWTGCSTTTIALPQQRKSEKTSRVLVSRLLRPAIGHFTAETALGGLMTLAFDAMYLSTALDHILLTSLSASIFSCSRSTSQDGKCDSHPLNNDIAASRSSIETMVSARVKSSEVGSAIMCLGASRVGGKEFM